MTSVDGPASRRTSASVPTASTRPSRTASACATVLASSARNTRPPTNTMSAACDDAFAGCAGGCGQPSCGTGTPRGLGWLIGGAWWAG
jgi:hypothetical protein